MNKQGEQKPEQGEKGMGTQEVSARVGSVAAYIGISEDQMRRFVGAMNMVGLEIVESAKLAAEANSGSIPIDYAAWIRDTLSKHKLPANDYYTPDLLREFHAAINSGSIKRGEEGFEVEYELVAVRNWLAMHLQKHTEHREPKRSSSVTGTDGWAVVAIPDRDVRQRLERINEAMAGRAAVSEGNPEPINQEMLEALRKIDKLIDESEHWWMDRYFAEVDIKDVLAKADSMGGIGHEA